MTAALLPASIGAQLAATMAVLDRHLAAVLEAVHVFGSAVDGGLKPASDLDLMVTVTAPLSATQRGSLMDDLLAISGEPGVDASRRPLEVTVVVRDEVVPWRYPPMRELQFGEWLRASLQDGVVEPATLDHDLAILLTKVMQHSACLFGPVASELFDPVPEADVTRALLDTIGQWTAEPDWHGDERTVVLALARIWYTAATGRIASKDAAAAWALERLPHGHRRVLASARASYLGIEDDDLARRAAEMAAFVPHVKAVIEGILAGRGSTG